MNQWIGGVCISLVIYLQAGCSGCVSTKDTSRARDAPKKKKIRFTPAKSLSPDDSPPFSTRGGHNVGKKKPSGLEPSAPPYEDVEIRFDVHSAYADIRDSISGRSDLDSDRCSADLSMLVDRAVEHSMEADFWVHPHGTPLSSGSEDKSNVLLVNDSSNRPVVMKYRSNCMHSSEENVLIKNFAFMQLLSPLGVTVRPIFLSLPSRMGPGLSTRGLVLDSNCSGADLRYLVMDRGGKSLRDFVRSSEGGKLSLHESLVVVKAVLRLVGHLHDRGIVHGDIHWGNVLFREIESGDFEDLVLVDFDRALFVQHEDESTDGAPLRVYQSPGELAGRRLHFSDDIFRIYEMIEVLLEGDAYYAKIAQVSSLEFEKKIRKFIPKAPFGAMSLISNIAFGKQVELFHLEAHKREGRRDVLTELLVDMLAMLEKQGSWGWDRLVGSVWRESNFAFARGRAQIATLDRANAALYAPNLSDDEASNIREETPMGRFGGFASIQNYVYRAQLVQTGSKGGVRGEGAFALEPATSIRVVVRYKPDCDSFTGKNVPISPLETEYIVSRILGPEIAPSVFYISPPSNVLFLPDGQMMEGGKQNLGVCSACGRDLCPVATDVAVRFSISEEVGPSLLRRISEEGGVSPTEAIYAFLAILKPLQKSHRKGIVHGDIHVGNVCWPSPESALILDEHTEFVLIDFERARLMTESDSKLTQSKLPFAKLAGVEAPWEIMGSQISFRDDLFRLLEALSYMLYRMGAEGEFPPSSFEKMTPQVAARQNRERVSFLTKRNLFKLEAENMPNGNPFTDPFSFVSDLEKRAEIDEHFLAVLNSVRGMDKFNAIPDYALMRSAMEAILRILLENN